MKRSERTVAWASDDVAYFTNDDDLDGACVLEAVQWQPGLQAPPFFASNGVAVTLLAGLAAGEAESPRGIRVLSVMPARMKRAMPAPCAPSHSVRCGGFPEPHQSWCGSGSCFSTTRTHPTSALHLSRT